jgi:hypothetical protein
LIAPNFVLILDEITVFKVSDEEALYLFKRRAMAWSFYNEMVKERALPILMGLQNFQFGLGSAIYTTSSFCLITLGTNSEVLFSLSFLKSESKSSAMWLDCVVTAFALYFMNLFYTLII